MSKLRMSSVSLPIKIFEINIILRMVGVWMVKKYQRYELEEEEGKLWPSWLIYVRACLVLGF